jgi:hypothetical protein
MRRECLNCEQGILRHAVKAVPYEYKGHATVVLAWSWTQVNGICMRRTEFSLTESA